MLELALLGILSDFQFVIQIFIMVSIMSFVLNHLGKGLLSMVVILVVFYVVFFIIPGLSEIVFILYSLLMIGFSTLLVDFFFITASAPQQQQAQEGEKPDLTGNELREKTAAMEKARHAGHQAAGMLQNMMRRGR
ncbi:MAG: hypothetical protein J4478_02335 [Candidatus Diapherotrites archaeon]|uniref:Uncharacterized protein n=1 Tax=Candidatus Iainarchaeum sp. TaxID=3101447 RepID=A0A7J4K2X9_9ARCH|nr:MAG: hypothetical protein QT12_C0005G0004 [archaeon GW2011_AR21]MBS3058217.1 hypothetical protein [Candidatus Diapherotrites archaeon]HIH21846.1 hypothetical protein [Candidatus Diapherotrites archaeon]HIH33036.1 hypothetical protein [Candidatus Diapherotrites archaeon]